MLVRSHPSQSRQVSRLLIRAFATTAKFDPHKFSQRFDTDLAEIQRYNRMAEKQAWKKAQHRPIKPDWAKAEHFIMKHKGFRQFVLGDKTISNSFVKWMAPSFWIMRELQDIYCVVIRGGTTKLTLPRGADLRAITDLVAEGKSPHPYFRDWYRLVYQAARFSRPLIACLAGRVGDTVAGFLMHTPYRVAFDDSCFHLSQTEIGFFPDAGLTYFLPRLDGAMGMYLALTGKKLWGTDMVHAGVATHFMKHSEYPSLVEHLEENQGFHSVVHSIMEWHDRFEIQQAPFSLQPHLDVIDRCFSKNSVEEIFLALDQEPKDGPSAEFVEQTVQVLQKKSPLSLKVTHVALTAGSKNSLEACLKMEYRLAQKMVQTPDFKEGCTALFEKRKPRWSASSISQVLEQDVRRIFKVHDEANETGDGSQGPELSLPIADYMPDDVRVPKWADGELFRAESMDPEAAELTKKSISHRQNTLKDRDHTSRWFEFYVSPKNIPYHGNLTFHDPAQKNSVIPPR